ncbi:rhomboid-like protein [Streptomyces sp. NPDC057249]|uniref:rhomboid-like protein n=1 Tax=Streptomyces sp. NPDC057249 TaxID=3346067 RepID=UPI003636A56B
MSPAFEEEFLVPTLHQHPRAVPRPRPRPHRRHVAATAHVLATLVSESILAWAIRHGHAPPSAADTLDMGASYALADVIAVLTYCIPRPWRPPYLFAVLVIYTLPLTANPTFTDIGHLTAALIGLGCYPLTRRGA